MRAPLARGALGSALMVVGGYCYDRLPRDTWPDRVSVLRSLRGSAHAVGIGLVLSAAGLLLLSWAWWDLWRGVRCKTFDVPVVRRTTAVWLLPLLCAPPLFSADGWSYVATGVLAGRGESPYLWTPAALPTPLRSGVAPVWRLTPSPYGPLSVSWGAAFSHLTRDPWALLAWYRGLAVLGLAILAWAVPVLAARVHRDPAEASVLALASPFVLAHGIGGLHNDLIMVALVAAALAVTRPGVWIPGALLAGAAAAMKVPGGLAVVGVVLLSAGAGAGVWARMRRTIVVGAVAASVVLAFGRLTGLGTGWIGALSVPDHEYTVLSLSTDVGRSVHALLMHAGVTGIETIHEVHPELLAKRIGVALLVVIVGLVLLRGSAEDPRRALGGAATVMLAAVVLSPAVHYWYFLWCVPLLACLPWERAAESALVTEVLVLGLTAPADRALHIRWLWEPSAWALVVVPVAVWMVATVRPWRLGQNPVST